MIKTVHRPKYNWGPSLWQFIHTITIIDFEGNNENNNQNALLRLINVQHVIPCGSCRSHYIENLKDVKQLDLKKPMVLFYWSVDFHNKVNKRLGKPVLSYNEAINLWCKKYLN
jgi:hypothetical protein